MVNGFLRTAVFDLKLTMFLKQVYLGCSLKIKKKDICFIPFEVWRKCGVVFIKNMR